MSRIEIIKPETIEMYDSHPQKHIEKIARTCYKSNDKITEESHIKFITNLYNAKHWAMLEHYIFIYEVPKETYDFLIDKQLKYLVMTNYNLNLISFSARTLLDISNSTKDKSLKAKIDAMIRKVVADFNCSELFGFDETAYSNSLVYVQMRPILELTELTSEERFIHEWHSIKFICDRGVSHEIVRHRDASFAQESTRYCNYSKDKFGNKIQVIKPFMLDDGDGIRPKTVEYDVWEKAMNDSAERYFEMIEAGCSPQVARSVLPNSLKTEVIMTARNYEWEHFFNLRCDSAAHPQMREIAIPLKNYLNKGEAV